MPSTKVCIVSWVRYYLIRWICCRLTMAILHFLFMCSHSVMCSSNQVPRYCMHSFFLDMDWVSTFLDILLLAKIMYSILSSFIFKWFSSIQFLTFTMQFSRFSLHLLSSITSLILNLSFSMWSSAKPLIVIGFSTTLCRVLAYTR